MQGQAEHFDAGGRTRGAVASSAEEFWCGSSDGTFAVTATSPVPAGCPTNAGTWTAISDLRFYLDQAIMEAS